METLSLFLVLAAVTATAVFALRLIRQVRDTELRLERCEAQLEARNRCLGLLARELEGPGLSLLGLVGGLDRSPAAAVELQARRLLRLAEEISDLVASEPGARRLEERAVVLGPLLKEVMTEVALPLGETSRLWRVSPEVETLTLLADLRALRRALCQALTRAVRETALGDLIAIRLVRAAETVAVVIEDEGAGLPSGDLAGLDGTRGLAFGLASARELLRAHGGELTLETAPGIGARTWLTLPRRRVLEDLRAAA
ncbi:sensor histidine kinase [Muricoccus radiodurans]|uniref:sensor histidine kinase n=1 Tax=Muricoccus radiodurans TaxID=2231721 RepID=UPI003CF132F3